MRQNQDSETIQFSISTIHVVIWFEKLKKGREHEYSTFYETLITTRGLL